MELKDKTILVTGATSGIGNAICLDLISKSAIVIGLGRDKSKLNQNLVNHSKFSFYSIDLTQIDQIETLLSNITKSFKLDGLVHCAGKEETVPISVYKHEKIHSLFEINIFSGIEFLRLFSKKKYTNNNSSIILFSSVMGELGQSGKVGYCSSKAAVLGAVRAASLELARRNIRANCISPGVVVTPMTEQLFSQLSEENIQEIKNMHPLGFGNVDDITPLVSFLLSDQSKWITGQNIKIDGGYSVQ